MLTTKRLHLRIMQEQDVPFLINLWTDPSVTEFMGGPRDRAALQETFNEIAADPHAERFDLWPVESTAFGDLVGHCGLIDKKIDGSIEIELVYVIAPHFWGQGYATEIGRGLVQYGFETMALSRIVALIAPENISSQRVALNVGLTMEKELTRPSGARRLLYVIEHHSRA